VDTAGSTFLFSETVPLTEGGFQQSHPDLHVQYKTVYAFKVSIKSIGRD